MTDLSSENVNWHLSQLMLLEYDCALFTDGSEASRLYMTMAALSMPPVAEKTSGVKEMHSDVFHPRILVLGCPGMHHPQCWLFCA